MRRMRRPIAIWLVDFANAILPAGLREWGHAMRCEALQANRDDDAIAFAWGRLTTSLRIRASYHIPRPSSWPLKRRMQLGWCVCAIGSLLAGMCLMLPTTMTLDEAFTAATLAAAALKVLPILALGLMRHKVSDLFANPVHAMLYFTSKTSGVLTVAFALAAAASAGRTGETCVLAGLLVVATAATFWTIFARVTGRFHGFAQIGRPA